MSSTPRRLRTLCASAVVAASALTLVACGGSGEAVPTPGASIGTRIDQALPQRILDLPFTSAAGKTVHLKDFKGKIVVLSDMLTLCQETCPLDTATVVQTARDENKTKEKAKNVVYLSVTVDPVRDTVPQISAYRKLYAPTPANWHVLTGKPADVNALWTFLGVWHKKTPNEGPDPKNWRTGAPLSYDIAHSDEVFFLDGRGHERFVLEGPPVAKKGEIPASIYTFMNSEGHENVAHPASTDWTEAQAREVLTWLSAERS